MSSKPIATLFHIHFPQVVMIALGAVVICLSSGCQDGPLYALKVANPFYTMGEWKNDEAIGVTDHERRKQLAVLADTIQSMPNEKQQFWSGHLSNMIENDDSPEMRRLAVRAAGRLSGPEAMAMIDKGLDDDSIKVRMEACKALGRRTDDESSRLLAATVGIETNVDVRHAALMALAGQKNEVAVDSLKLALSDRDPATRHLAVESLKGATGKDFGDDPAVWIAKLGGAQNAGETSNRF